MYVSDNNEVVRVRKKTKEEVNCTQDNVAGDTLRYIYTTLQLDKHIHVALENNSKLSYTRPAQLQIAQSSSQRALRRQYPSIGPESERMKIFV